MVIKNIKIFIFTFFWCVLCCFAVFKYKVFAAEDDYSSANEEIYIDEYLTDDDPLMVDIINSLGQSILPSERNFIYTNNELVFSPRVKEYTDGEICDNKIYYSFVSEMDTTDNLNELENGIVRLAPVSEKSEYDIQFIQKTVIKSFVEDECSEGDEDAAEDDEQENSEQYTKTDNIDGKESDEEIKEISYREYYKEITCVSKAYHICFDLIVPNLNEKSAIEWSKWVNYERTAEFVAEDEGSGLSRVIVKSGNGEVIYEYHYGGNENDISYKNEFNVNLFNPSKDTSGETFTITIYDIAGNVFDKSFTYYYDNVKPTLELAGVNDKTINSKNITILFKGADNIQENLKLYYRIWGEKCTPQGVILEKEEDLLSGNSLEETLMLDGLYTVEAKIVDKALNESETIKITFRIDKNSPELKIEGFVNGQGYSKPVTGYLSIKELFFEDMSARIKVIKKTPLGDEVYIEENIKPNESEYTKDFYLPDDGDYYISVRAEDAAGNISDKEGYLRVDCNAPQISISGMEDKEITKNYPTLLISLDETFYDSMISKTMLYKKNDEGLFEQIIESPIVADKTIYSFPLSINEEGIYLLKIMATDKTGNSSEKDIEFTYDCTSPTIGWLNTVHKKYLKNLKFPFQFTEYITDRTAVSYKAFLNTENIKEGDSIVRDGKYILRITAVDEAGNVSDESAEFIIDTKAPRIIVSGLNPNKQVKKGDEIIFTLYDSEDFFEYASVNGKEIKLLDDKKCVFKIDKEGDHYINIRASDFAGNEIEKSFMIACNKNIGGLIRGNLKTANIGQDADYKSQSLKINKKNEEKYPYIFCALILGVFTVGALILLGLRRVDTTKKP